MSGILTDKKGRRIGAPPPSAIVVDETAPERRAKQNRLSSPRAAFFGGLAHPVRLAILEKMADGRTDGAAATDLAGELEETPGLETIDTALVDHHFKKLASVGLVRPTELVDGSRGRTTKQLYVITEKGRVAARFAKLVTQLPGATP